MDLFTNYSGKKVLIGLSGGINSMAVLCWLARLPEDLKPKELHLFYAHFLQHSEDTMPFVLAGLACSGKHFTKVYFKQTENDVLQFFESQKMIPHPAASPCTRVLKIQPIQQYKELHQIDVDLIGYVREEKRRISRMESKYPLESINKEFPIQFFSNEWCFEIVKDSIGWYPSIYDHKEANGKRIFKHNNCLPCKNMSYKELEMVKKYYPEKMESAIELSLSLDKYWGRNKVEYYTRFGREDYEKSFMSQPCEVCAFD